MEAGARFLQRHVVDLVRRDGRVRGVAVRSGDGVEEVYARLVVGADGLRSIVARRLGLVRRKPRLKKVSLTVHIPAPTPPLDHGEMHVVPGGCAGYAPAGDGVCNLTIVTTTDRAAELGRIGPAAFVRRQVERAPRLRARLGDQRLRLEDIPADEFLASGPFDWPTRSPTAQGAALVGDAAGYYDPFTGQGIHQAMAGAERLAAAVGPALAGEAAGDAGALDAALRRYARDKRRLTRPTRRVQHLVEWVLSRPTWADRAVARLARAETAMDRLVEVTGDLRPPASLISPDVVSSLLFPATRRPH